MVQPIGAHLDELDEFQAFMLQAQASNAVLLAIAQLGLLDNLDDTPATAADIAARGGLHAPSVARVLRFLAAQQIIDADSAERFRHTARSRRLQKTQSGLKFLRETMGAAQGMAECLRTGVPAFECHFGEPVFEYLSKHKDAAQYFGDLMSRTTAIVEAYVFDQHRFEPFELAIDVGGSHGRLMIALLERHSKARGIVFDTPETVRQAAAIVARSPVAKRIEMVGGDFFEAVPAGGDLYLMKQVLHDWGDEDCVRILSSIRKAIADGGRLALIEYLLPGAHEPHPGFAMDVHMMALSTGKERTLAAYEALLAAAGFKLGRVTENAQGQSVAEAIASQ